MFDGLRIAHKPEPVCAESLVDVWYACTESFDEDRIGSLLDTLSEQERLSGERLQFKEDRRDYIVGHALLRCALAFRTGRPPSSWRFERGPSGKPYVAPNQPAYDISLTHTRGLVSCAVTCVGPVGIDVEGIDPRLDAQAIARSCFSAREVAALRECPAQERPCHFTELWTLKESFLKATGMGLANGLAHFSLEFGTRSDLVFHPPPDCPQDGWRFELFAPSEGHRLALAVCSPPALDFRIRVCCPDRGGAPIKPIRSSFHPPMTAPPRGAEKLLVAPRDMREFGPASGWTDGSRS